MKCRDQWRPFVTKCQRHGTFSPSWHMSVHEQCAVPLALLFFIETATRHFMPGWAINVPLGQVAVWKRLNLVVYCLCHLLAASAKGTFCCPARYEMPGPTTTLLNQVPKARHIFTVVAQERSRTMCRAFGTIVFCRNHTRHFMPGWAINVPLGQTHRA